MRAEGLLGSQVWYACAVRSEVKGEQNMVHGKLMSPMRILYLELRFPEPPQLADTYEEGYLWYILLFRLLQVEAPS